MARADGRDERAIRALHLCRDFHADCASSSCVEIGDNRVLCVVRGPFQLISEQRGSRGRVFCAVDVTDSESNSSVAAISGDFLSLALESVAEHVALLEAFPQLAFSCRLHVLSSDGADLSALCTALCAALISAGVELKNLFSAGTAALSCDGTVILDPTAAELASSMAFCSVVATASGDICHVTHKGHTSPSVLSLLMGSATEVCMARKDEIKAQLRGG